MVTAARQHPVARAVVLGGWAAKGVVYVALAWIVLQMAFAQAPQQATTTGALELIANTAPGRIAMLALGVGLIAYAVGRVLEVSVLAGPRITGSDKAKAAVLAVLYTALALTAFTIVGITSGSGGSGGSTEQQGSAFLLGLPGGQLLVGLVGAAVIAVGLVEAYKGVKSRFLPTLRVEEMSQQMRSAADKVGTAAYVTKGFIFVLLGYFFVQSAVTYDPDQARGLDAALREVAQTSYGTVVLALVGVGLLAYGAFALLEARYRRVGSSATGTT